MHRHRWNSWHKIVVRRDGDESFETRQERECAECGAIQSEHLYFGEER